MTDTGLNHEALAQAVTRECRLVRVLVAATAGSTPREAGAAMLVWPGGQSGTIGGGALEWQAMRRARAMLDAWPPAARIDRLPLGPALGQCCGGGVTLVYEPWDAARIDAHPPQTAHLMRPIASGPPAAPSAMRRMAARAETGEGRARVMLSNGWLIEPLARAAIPLWVWGAGHVGRALVGVMAPLPGWSITWIDHSADCFPDDLPSGVLRRHCSSPEQLAPDAPPEARHVIATRSHSTDLAICHGLLVHGFASAGLIGSATKTARFRARLRALGHARNDIMRLQCPIGAKALGKHPQAIAIGVAHDLLHHGLTAGISASVQERLPTSDSGNRRAAAQGCAGVGGRQFEKHASGQGAPRQPEVAIGASLAQNAAARRSLSFGKTRRN